jgi:thiol-disulfide isomerase/thioredoxin
MFFSPSCGHCHKAWPKVEEWNARYSERGLKVVAVSSGYANAQDLEFFAQDMGGNFVFPVFHDSAKVLAERMKVKSVPVFFLVDPKGNYQRWVGSLPTTLEQIENTIARNFRWRRSKF